MFQLARRRRKYHVLQRFFADADKGGHSNLMAAKLASSRGPVLVMS
jgi:hypothetical protein